MSKQFPIIKISSKAPVESETMGTKEKFWFHHEELGLCLYKKARQNTGEDWSEKIAAELCKLIKLPHAEYELALFNNEKGTISQSFLPKNGSLITGNEILVQILLDYPENINDLSQHTLNNIFKVFSNNSVELPLNWMPLEGIETAMDIFIGYLLLDAWIGNTDRHHENWAFINYTGKNYLAPTYDHASSLGRNESDERRTKRLTTKDKGFSVEAYAHKCKSCLYAKVGDRKPLTTLDAFREAAQIHTTAANIWLDQLSKVSINDTLELFKRIPGDRISSTAIKFAQKILEINQHKLLKFCNDNL
ncbi:MAG: hypothetical protein QNJ42_23550 [Crocosphaera sp.]|nr:hypothetical protein [Crocosphaera sp.]